MDDFLEFGRGVAQLVARVLWEHEVARSNRVAPTKFEFAPDQSGCFGQLICVIMTFDAG